MKQLEPLILIYESMGYHTYYHVSPARNSKNILSKGLISSTGDRSLKYGEIDNNVYLFGSEDDAQYAVMNWLGDEFDENEPLALFQITLPVDWPIDHNDEEFEYRSKISIPPNLIKLLNSNY